eukprot:1635005-Lingulodinium_polyedra.AAC.1
MRSRQTVSSVFADASQATRTYPNMIAQQTQVQSRFCTCNGALQPIKARWKGAVCNACDVIRQRGTR